MASGLCAVVGLGAASTPAREPANVAAVLARARRALFDSEHAAGEPFEVRGNLSGLGLAGTFFIARDGAFAREHQALGARTDDVYRHGDRIVVRDADGDERVLHAEVLRHVLTEEFVEDGEFAAQPQRARFLGESRVGAIATEAIATSAPGGDEERVDLDRATGRPVRLRYAEDDGESTVRYADWRDVGGRWIAWTSTYAHGDDRYSLAQTVTHVEIGKPVPRDRFAPPAPARIASPAPQWIALDLRAGHAFAPVRIGTHTYSFIVDSGAQDIVLDTAVAREIGLATQGSFQASGTAVIGGVSIARLPRLDIGTATLSDLVVSTLSLGDTASGERIDGILGYPLFAQSMVEIDARTARMRLGAPGSFAPPGVPVPVTFDRELPETPADFGAGVRAPVLLDTGNAGALLLYRPFVDAHPGVVAETSDTRRSSGIGGATASYRSTLPRLRLGAVTIDDVATDVMLATRGAFADRFAAGNVGMGVLQSFAVTFDAANGFAYLARDPPPSANR